MIYLDNAATTWPKPLAVRRAVGEAFEKFGANPGRGGHSMAIETAKQVYLCRETAADMFGLDDPSQVVFTSNCTMALNFLIKGLLKTGDHVVVSDMEHNSVIRPLEAMAERGVTYSKAVVYPENKQKTVESFQKCINFHTRLILCTHASNVFGTILPIREIGALAHKNDLLFAVDAAQSAGILPLNMQQDNIDFLCMPGHKGLYGPMGTGMFLCRDKMLLATLVEGGTGSSSLMSVQPSEWPERFESGTINVPGICGLYAGMQWVKQHGIDSIRHHETSCMQQFYENICSSDRIHLYTPAPKSAVTVPLLSFNVVGLPSEETALRLSQYGIAVRAGLHCAPVAHKHANTLPEGTVRVAPSMFTDKKQMEITYKILMKISIKP